MNGLKRFVKALFRLLMAPWRALRHRTEKARRAGEPATTRREVPNDEFLPRVHELIRAGHSVTIGVKGNSMRPFLIHARDKVVLTPFDTLRVGDAVLARVEQGMFVLHRIICMDGDRLTLMGDGNVRGTETCRVADVAGLVGTYIHRGRAIPASDPRLCRRVRLWCRLLPVRRVLLFFYQLLD